MRDVARVLLEQGLEEFGAKAAGIVWMMRPGKLELVLGRGLTDAEFQQLDELARAGERLPIRDAILGRRSIWLETPEEIRRRYPVLEPIRARRGESGCAVVPLVLGDRCPGVIGFTFAREQPFADEERTFIDALAQLSAYAFERARLFEAEQDARREADRAREVQERLVAVVGHDLRVPLSAITGATDMIERQGELNAVQRKALALLRSSSRRMTAMIAEILDFSLVRRGLSLPIRHERTDLARVTTRAVQEFAASGHEARISLETHGDLDLNGDPDRLFQVVSNLVGNALQHGAGSPVRVEVREQGEHVLLIVRNGGPPIPGAQLPTVFEAFQQATGGQGGERAGLGLGLFIVREVVHAHGGTVAVRSSADGGTAFEVVLPRQRGELPRP